MWPKTRHVSTCLPCGYREAFRLTNSYPERCPHCGTEVEHDVVSFDDGLELDDVPREPRPLFLQL
jgi:PHP family Zn ribbon phosphoesterase